MLKTINIVLIILSVVRRKCMNDIIGLYYSFPIADILSCSIYCYYFLMFPSLTYLKKINKSDRMNINDDNITDEVMSSSSHTMFHISKLKSNYINQFYKSAYPQKIQFYRSIHFTLYLYCNAGCYLRSETVLCLLPALFDESRSRWCRVNQLSEWMLF